MFTHEELTHIAELRSDDGVVSAYLRIDPHLMHDPTQPLVKFKGASKRYLRRSTDERARASLERERDRIARFLKGWKPRGRALAIFACTPAGIWEVVPLEVPVPSLVTVDTTTHTALLAQVLDEYPRFVVAVVQRDKARLYVAEQRTAETLEAISSAVPGRHDQGGWSQARFQRHIEFHVTEHLKKVALELERWFYAKRFNRLAVGGAEEAVHELSKMLPEPVRRTVIGTFPVNLKHDDDTDLLERARRVWEEHERQSELDLVATLADAAASNGRGVLGIDAVLEAVVGGRVQILAVADGVEKEGSACLRCDYIAARAFDRCPVCGGDAERAPDIIERAIERAYLTGAHIETVFADAREHLLARGGLGALLRY
jgi:peptide chain release factor subunit 1